MIEFIIIWLVGWLLVIATTHFIYKGENWFVRYWMLVCIPISVIAILIASMIIKFAFEQSAKDFFRYTFTWLFKGWDFTTQVVKPISEYNSEDSEYEQRAEK